MRQLFTVILTALLIISTVPPIIAADNTDGDPSVEITVTQSNTHPDKITYTLQYNVPHGIDNFVVFFEDNSTQNIETTGFRYSEYPENQFVNRYKLTTTHTPTITFTVNTSKQRTASFMDHYLHGENWASGETPYVEMMWWNGETDEWERLKPFGNSEDPRVTYTGKPGYYGENLFYAGPHTSHSQTIGASEYTLITPEAASPVNTPKEIFNTLRTANKHTKIERNNNHDITIIESPSTDGGGYTYHRSGDLLVNEEATANKVGSVYIHEYYHTQQNPNAFGTDMRWYIEADAEYQSYKIPAVADENTRTAKKAYQKLKANSQSGTLTNQATWGSNGVPYDRGAVVLAKLDMKIQNATNGTKTIGDVSERINQKSHPVTYPEFKDIVATVAGERMDGWLDSHVASNEPVSVDGWVETITAEPTTKPKVQPSEPTITETEHAINRVEQIAEKRTDMELVIRTVVQDGQLPKIR